VLGPHQYPNHRNLKEDSMTTITFKDKANPLKRKQHLAAYGFVLPFMVMFLAMLVIPLVYSGYLSFFVNRIIGGVSFVGLENYARAFQDPGFIAGLGRTSLFLVIQVPIMLALALCFSLALDSGYARGSNVLRLLIFMPYAVPSVVATLMWGYLYGKNFGLIGQLAKSVGLPAPELLSGEVILFSIMNIVTWAFVGYNMIIMYSALKSIPAEIYEAAEIDGAGQWRLAWSVKIPAIRPAILLTAIFSVIGSFQIFAEPSLLSPLAPSAISQSFTPNFYAYNLAFVNRDVNYAAAIAFLLGFVIMIVSYIVQLSTQKRGARS
jgi:multiple sugar transport system permease protein